MKAPTNIKETKPILKTARSFMVYLWAGGDLELTNLLSGQSAKARVVGTRRSHDAAFLGVAVALAVPDETFWGVNFLLRKTSADLANIEQAIGAGGVDPRILREFRGAVDYVRKAAWVVQEWHERIRRATQLNKAIATDLAAHELTSETVGLEELFQAVESLYQRVADLPSCPADRPERLPPSLGRLL